MEYIDWIISSAIFFTILISILLTLPNYLPIYSNQEDEFTSLNIYNSITDIIDDYKIIKVNDDSEIYPYMINLDNNNGRCESNCIVDNNVVYGVVYDKTNFYNFTNTENVNNIPGTLIKKEDFEDYNYEDTFEIDNNETIEDYNYYIEDNGTNKYIWTKLDLPASTTTTIYLSKGSYNNPNGSSIFEFFDDFDGDSLDSHWATIISGSDYSLSNGELRIDTGGMATDNLGFNIQSNYIVESRVKYISSDSWYGGSLPELCSSNFGQSSNAGGDALIYYMRGYSKDNIVYYASDGSTANEYNIGSSSFVSSTNNVYYKFKEEMKGDTFSLYMDDESLITKTGITWSKNLNYVSIGSFFNSNQNIQDSVYDYLFIRKYTAFEPTITVTDEGKGLYKIDIINNESLDLNDYQVRIPNNVIGVNSKTESLLLRSKIYENIDYGKYKLENDKNIITNNNYYDFNAFLDFDSDELNIFFNYIDAENSFKCEINETNFKLVKISSGVSTTVGNINLEKDTDWRKINFGSTKDNKVFCNINGENIEYTNLFDINSGKILLESVDTSSYIDNFYIYKNNDIASSSTDKKISATNFNFSINNNISTVNFLSDSEDIGSFDLIFDDNLTVPDTNNIALIKDSSLENKLLVFPQAKEFWLSIDSNENIDVDLDNNIQFQHYPYYIEENDKSKYIWTKLDLPAKTKTTIYLYKTNGYSPSQDDVFGNNLEAFYTFNGNANDTSINNYDGKVSGAELTTDRNGNEGFAYYFNSSKEEYIDTTIDKNLSQEGDFSISLWAQPNIFQYAISQSHTAEPYSSDFFIGFHSGNDLFWMRSAVLGNTTSYEDGNWYNFVMVWDKNTETYEGFVDGSSLGTSKTISNYGGVNSIIIGSRGDRTTTFFDGKIDDVRIYSRKLTSNEIKNLSLTNEPTITVTDLGNNVYKVDVTNNETTDLEDYQIRIPNDIIGVTSTTESLLIKNDNSETLDNLNLYADNKIIMLNVFDRYSNVRNCDFEITSNGFTIKNCNSDSIIKVRIRDDNTYEEYPKIIINKNKKRLITKEKIDNLKDSNNYYLLIDDEEIKTTKGNNKKGVGKIFEKYTPYLNELGQIRIVKTLIKPY